MKKKTYRFPALLLAAAVFGSSLSLPARAAAFADVPSDAWYRDHVYSLVDRGVIHGTGPSQFSPEDMLTRGAFATMLANTILTPQELNLYDFTGEFKDMKRSHWANRYVNWASEAGIVNGYEDGTFRPDQPVSRQEMAVMVVKFSNVTGRRLDPAAEVSSFADSASVAKYAASSVQLCQRAGVINGYKDGTFRPKGLATRAEAATLYDNFLKLCKTGNYQVTNKRVLSTAVRAVEFDLKDYVPDLALGRDLVDGGESVSTLVSRTGAAIAVNGAFFDMSSYLPLGTLIKEGRVVTLFEKYAPAKSALVLDGEGNFSIQNFSTSYTVTLHKEDGTDSVLKDVTVNRWPSDKQDATRILFTRDWGHTLCFEAVDAVTMDENGVILSIDHGKDMAIPEKGYVLAQRARRKYEGDFFDSCKVGDQLNVQRVYEGAAVEDIRLSIGAGPRIVKDGAAYGELGAYRAEGFTDPNITTYSARRVCLGLKPNGKVLLLTAYTTLSHLSEIMVSMGCTDAINFDGGGSTNLYVNGCWLYGPQNRKLNNMLVFRSK